MIWSKRSKENNLIKSYSSSSAEMSTNNVVVWSGSTLFATITLLTNDVIKINMLVGWLVLLLYVPSQQLWSLRDGHFT